MKSLGMLLGYNTFLVQSAQDCKDIVRNAPKEIGFFGFDTETNSRLNMANKQESSPNIKHDLPFMLQFGYNDTVYLVDFREFNDVVAITECFEELVKRSKLALAFNIKFDIHMLWNIGYVWKTPNCCDVKAIARLALESKSEREGGLRLALKPLAHKLLGPAYSEAGHQVNDALRIIWHQRLKELERLLKPHGITRAIINEILKDPTSTLDEFTEEVQVIWSSWLMNSKVTYQEVDKNLMQRYGAVDVILVLECTKKLLPIIHAKKQVNVLKRENQLIMPLVRMERTGFTIDKKYLIKCKQALIFEINSIRALNESICGEKITANQHNEIKDMIKRKFNYDLPSSAAPQMQILIDTDPTMPQEVREYLSNVIYLRTLEKWLVTYINSMLNQLNHTHDTKVYTQYDANGAVTGRFSSNFQQFPKEPIISKVGKVELFSPRKMFIVDKDYPEMAYIDYSQVELRIQAEYTYYATKGLGDINMLRAYMPFKCHKASDGKWIQDDTLEDWEGVDLHTQSTHEAFPEVPLGTPEFKHLRSLGKRVNFALIYGASLKRIQATLADCDPNDISKLYYGFHSKFRDVKTYQNWVSQNWINNGGYVTNLLGRRYYINDPKDVYKLNNYLIQGSAADIIKMVICRVDNYLRANKLKTRLQGCIHDELCICVAEGEHDVLYKIKEIMETTVKTYVPLVAEISVSTTNWAEKKGV